MAILARDLDKAHRIFDPVGRPVQFLVGDLHSLESLRNVFRQCTPAAIMFAAGYSPSGVLEWFTGPSQKEQDYDMFYNLVSVLQECGFDIPIVFLSYMWITWRLSPLNISFGKVQHRLAGAMLNLQKHMAPVHTHNISPTSHCLSHSSGELFTEERAQEYCDSLSKSIRRSTQFTWRSVWIW